MPTPRRGRLQRRTDRLRGVDPPAHQQIREQRVRRPTARAHHPMDLHRPPARLPSPPPIEGQPVVLALWTRDRPRRRHPTAHSEKRLDRHPQITAYYQFNTGCSDSPRPSDACSRRGGNSTRMGATIIPRPPVTPNLTPHAPYKVTELVALHSGATPPAAAPSGLLHRVRRVTRTRELDGKAVRERLQRTRELDPQQSRHARSSPTEWRGEHPPGVRIMPTPAGPERPSTQPEMTVRPSRSG